MWSVASVTRLYGPDHALDLVILMFTGEFKIMGSDVDADERLADHGTACRHRTKRLSSGMNPDGKSARTAHPDPDFVFEGVDDGGSRNPSIGL